jgi:allantoinase
MEPDRIAYSAIIDRPPIVWPNGARIALWIVPNLEYYELLPPPHRARDPWPRTPHPDVQAYGARDYGNRVGLWRLFEVMDRHRIRCTVSLNLALFEHFPELLDECEARRWDYLCHGIYNTRYLFGMPIDEEIALVRDCVETFRRLTGRPLAGWLSPGLTYTLNTPDLVAEAGIKYYCDWVHDDQPFPMRVRSGRRLISLPYSVELNDTVMHRQGHEAEEFTQVIRDQFDTLYAEGGRVMCIALHPNVSGQPHRIRLLDEALSYVLGHDGVWQATGEEIADWYYANCFDRMSGAS